MLLSLVVRRRDSAPGEDGPCSDGSARSDLVERVGAAASRSGAVLASPAAGLTAVGAGAASLRGFLRRCVLAAAGDANWVAPRRASAPFHSKRERSEARGAMLSRRVLSAPAPSTPAPGPAASWMTSEMAARSNPARSIECAVQRAASQIADPTRPPPHPPPPGTCAAHRKGPRSRRPLGVHVLPQPHTWPPRGRLASGRDESRSARRPRSVIPRARGRNPMRMRRFAGEGRAPGDGRPGRASSFHKGAGSLRHPYPKRGARGPRFRA